jgi:N-acetylmuramoyl-L-alanine amidase
LGSKTKEKDVALAVALKLGKYIEDNFKDVKVIYTRKTDVFVELFERASIANNAKADLFICIHCNSACVYDRKKKKDICNPEPQGVETWVMGLHKSEANLAVAKRENEVVMLEKDYKKSYDGFDPNSPEGNIIFSLYQNTFLDQSLRFASNIEDEISRKGRDQRGVKQAGFLVLYKTYMPSVLIETGFLSNPGEEKFLSSEKGQDQIAHSIFNAFRSYKNSVESNISIKEKDLKTGNAQNTEEKKSVETEIDSNAGQKADTGENERKEMPLKAASTDVKKDKPEQTKTPVKAVTKLDELLFSVQVVLSPKPLSKGSGKLKGLKDIREEKADKTYKYCSGNFTSLDDAIVYQAKMRETGFKDAFVVAFKNGSRITMKEAREMLQKK